MKNTSLIFPIISLLIVGAGAFYVVDHHTPQPCKLESASGFVSEAPCSPELRAMMERQDGCEHFAGEEAYDAERGAFLNQQMDMLGCNTLAAEKEALVKSYITAKDEAALSVFVDYERYAHGQLIDGAPIDNPDAPANAAIVPDARVIIMQSRL